LQRDFHRKIGNTLPVNEIVNTGHAGVLSASRLAGIDFLFCPQPVVDLHVTFETTLLGKKVGSLGDPAAARIFADGSTLFASGRPFCRLFAG
jgi:hypothetical protein